MSEWVNDFTWYHKMPYEGGVTPGLWNQESLENIVNTYTFTGDRVLDVGTLDGKWGFMALKKGAKSVLSIDPSPRPTWSAYHKSLNSPPGISYIKTTLEELVSHQYHPTWDLILDFGVYYHTEDLVAHFRSLYHALENDGTALIEGEVILDGSPGAAYFYPIYENGDGTTHWVPTPSCLESILGYVGFTCNHRIIYENHTHRGRMFLEVTIA